MTCGIYCIENLINGKKYIGKSKNLKRRMSHSHDRCLYIKSAIDKYGKENFCRYIVKYCELEKLDFWEQYYIIEWNTKAPGGYNLTDGGGGGINPSEESRKKMSIAQKGRSVSDKAKEKISIAHKGTKVSNKTKEKMSVAHSGKIKLKKAKNSSSNFFGVSKHVYKNKWVYWAVHIKINGKETWIGESKKELDAALMYDKYVKENGLLNPLNFPS